MNIIIIGAGGIGRHIASVLSKEGLKVAVVDKNAKKLKLLSSEITTYHGSGADWQLMDDLLDISPDIVLALTDQDETNLAVCAIAKHLGYPKTIARLSDSRFLNQTRLDFSHIFDVDYFIAPELLAANDVLKYMISRGSLAVENFAQGGVQMRTLAIPDNWKKSEIPLMNLNLPKEIMVGLIYRDVVDEQGKVSKKIIFPHGNDFLLPRDEITFIGETHVISELHTFFGVKQKDVKSVIIVGGSRVGLNLARILASRGVEVRLIEKDIKRCKFLSEHLTDCTVIHHDGTDVEFLRSEKIHLADVFVAATSSDEINITTGALGKHEGCSDVVAVLSRSGYSSLASKLGINHAISPRVCAADQVLSQILSGNVTSLVSFYENQAEVVEVKVALDSKIAGIPISDLGPLLPKDFLIAIIQNRGRIMVASGNRIISPGDTVILITRPQHISELKDIF